MNSGAGVPHFQVPPGLYTECLTETPFHDLYPILQSDN